MPDIKRAAINRARFLLSSGDDIRGQLKNILGWINEQMTEKQLDMNAVYELEEMDRLVRIFSWEYLDIDSLYAPIEGRKEFVPEKIRVTAPDPISREEKRRKMLARLENVLSPERIGQYVEKQLGEQSEIRASQLPLSSRDAFIRLIYIRLYGQRKKMRYGLRMMEMVEKDGYTFRDFMIFRKGRED